MAEKISKSKDPKYAWDSSGVRAELQPDEGPGRFFLAIEDAEDDRWHVVDVTLDQLREALAFAERYEKQARSVSPSDAPSS